ncbi:unnamed protein product [Blumeria hordei]|uniref:Major facilitator superfamily (MFS) profile domain-containing protein n=1 Tax=Blumeria hordei TaxID=2867405 RepID=A0A383UL68_BLUHO|nr:unnamed protein product [Blumeria hordei]
MEDADLIPGTSRIFSDTDPNYSSRHAVQPSNSLNDPLNWSLPRKYWHTFLLCYITGLTAATSNDAGSTQDGVHRELGITFAAMNISGGVTFLGIAIGTFLLSPVAWLYGRRLPYLICISLGILGAVWMSQIKNTQDAIWNQLLVGVSESTAEANVQLSLSEVWFEHQRGTVLGMYVLATSIGTFLGPLISSYVAENLGWRWVALTSVIISSITLVVFLFGLEETLFEGNYPSRRASNAHTARLPSSSGRKTRSNTKVSPTGNSQQSLQVSGHYSQEEFRPFLQRIRLIRRAPILVGTGMKQYFSLLLHSLRVLTFPAVLYSGIQWGAQDAWLTFYLTLEEGSWMQSPRNYSTSQSGLMNIPTLIGAIIGCFWGGYLSDRLVLHVAKRRQNIAEAEDRLWMMLPCIILSPVGLLIFGMGTAKNWSWPWPYMGLIMIGFGWGCAGDLSMSYLMDAYPEMVLEGMVGVSLINNSLGLLFTFAANTWIENNGVSHSIIGLTCLAFFFLLLTIPMIVWGKSCRRRTVQRYQDFIQVRNEM